MPNLIGTAPNQVPTNGALGNMAFQNKEAVSVDTLVTTALTVTGTGALTVGGTQIVKDASGNVGIGTSSPGARLDVSGLSRFTAPAFNFSELAIQARYSGSFSTVALGQGADGTGYLINQHNAALAFGSNATEAMRIDASGRVGIGTSTPGLYPYSGLLNVAGGISMATGNRLGWGISDSFTLNGVTTAHYGFTYGGGSNLITTSGYHGINFATLGSERMRIDSSGNLLVGTTTNINSARTFIKGSSDAMGVQIGNTSVAQGAIVFYDGSGDYCGQVQVDPSTNTTSYVTSSDARLKENVTDAATASNLIDAIKVRQFDWKADGSHQRYGMVAQELLEVAPEAVSVPSDPDQMMGVDYSKLVPMMLKEIQSLRARMAQLEGN